MEVDVLRQLIEVQRQKNSNLRLLDTHKKRKSVYSSMGSCWTNLPSALTWSSRRRKSERGRLVRWSNLGRLPLPSCTPNKGLTYHTEKVGLQRPREQWRRQVPQVLLQQAGDGVDIVELAALEQVDVPFGIEALLQLPDHVGTPGQAEDAFFVLGVLQRLVLQQHVMPTERRCPCLTLASRNSTQRYTIAGSSRPGRIREIETASLSGTPKTGRAGAATVALSFEPREVKCQKDDLVFFCRSIFLNSKPDGRGTAFIGLETSLAEYFAAEVSKLRLSGLCGRSGAERDRQVPLEEAAAAAADPVGFNLLERTLVPSDEEGVSSSRIGETFFVERPSTAGIPRASASRLEGKETEGGS